MAGEPTLDEKKVKEGVEFLRQYYRASRDGTAAAFRNALAGFTALDKSHPDEMDKAREIYFRF